MYRYFLGFFQKFLQYQKKSQEDGFLTLDRNILSLQILLGLKLQIVTCI